VRDQVSHPYTTPLYYISKKQNSLCMHFRVLYNMLSPDLKVSVISVTPA
jgi:hypothetical protein